jgi:hypothetical protein
MATRTTVSPPPPSKTERHTPTAWPTEHGLKTRQADHLRAGTLAKHDDKLAGARLQQLKRARQVKRCQEPRKSERLPDVKVGRKSWASISCMRLVKRRPTVDACDVAGSVVAQHLYRGDAYDSMRPTIRSAYSRWRRRINHFGKTDMPVGTVICCPGL